MVSFDQMKFYTIPVLNKEVNKCKFNSGLNAESHIAVVLAFAISGKSFPLQVNYQGKTDKIIPISNSLKDLDITHIEHYWRHDQSLLRFAEMDLTQEI